MKSPYETRGALDTFLCQGRNGWSWYRVRSLRYLTRGRPEEPDDTYTFWEGA